MTLEATRGALGDAGFNLTGTLPRAEYDARVPDAWRADRVHPGCRGVLVVGNGGRVLWPIFVASPEAELRRNPLDRYTRRVLRDVADGVSAGFALYSDKRDDSYLPLTALAECCGFGSPGRVGVLIHREFGPWISIRGALFLNEAVPFAEPSPFDPCHGCPAPCATACHGRVVGPETVDVEGCFRTKLTDRRCRAACDARSACVVGPEHAFSAEQIAHHSRIHWRPATVRHAARALLRPRGDAR